MFIYNLNLYSIPSRIIDITKILYIPYECYAIKNINLLFISHLYITLCLLTNL